MFHSRTGHVCVCARCSGVLHITAADADTAPLCPLCREPFDGAVCERVPRGVGAAVMATTVAGLRSFGGRCAGGRRRGRLAVGAAVCQLMWQPREEQRWPQEDTRKANQICLLNNRMRFLFIVHGAAQCESALFLAGTSYFGMFRQFCASRPSPLTAHKFERTTYHQMNDANNAQYRRDNTYFIRNCNTQPAAEGEHSSIGRGDNFPSSDLLCHPARTQSDARPKSTTSVDWHVLRATH